DAADPGADDRADAIAVAVADRQAGLVERLLRRGDGVVGEPVHAAGLFAVEVPLEIEAPDLASEPGLVLGRIGPRDRGGARSALARRPPGRLHVAGEGRPQADPGYDDAPLTHRGIIGARHARPAVRRRRPATPPAAARSTGLGTSSGRAVDRAGDGRDDPRERLADDDRQGARPKVEAGPRAGQQRALRRDPE